MEELLRGQTAAEIIPFDFSAPCLYFPIRHHSPACSWHLKKAIEEYRPDCILIEGPENADSLIPILASEESKTPLALYYSFQDNEGRLGTEKGAYKCYYPFTACSPEYVAMKEAVALGISCHLIDLSYGEILMATARDQGILSKEEKVSYNDDYLLSRSRFVQLLCEKTGLRSFEEFWEKYFEIRAFSMSTQEFVAQLHAYCLLARQNTPAEEMKKEGCLARERHMAKRIEEFRGHFHRVLVVTGGFHTWGLLHPEEGEESSGIPGGIQSVYPMAYTLEALDALNGYASGMPSPGFYHRVWTMMAEGKEQPWDEAVLDFLVGTGRRLRQGGFALSAYDEICAMDMARGLAELRGKGQPGLYELQDAVLSSFVKGEVSPAVSEPLRILGRLLTGTAVGRLCDQALVPPLVKDFEEQCRAFRLKIQESAASQVVLNIFTSARHRQISAFLYQTSFLDCGFARRQKGPDLLSGRDRNLIREIWSYQWSGPVMAALIDHSVSGATVEEACKRELEEGMDRAASAEEGARLMVWSFLMGISGEARDFGGRMEELLAADGDFFSLGKACASLNTLCRLRTLYRQEGKELERLLEMCFVKLSQLLPSMTRIRDEQLTDCIQVCALLYELTGRKEFAGRREELMETFEAMARDAKIHPGLHGGVLGLLYGGDTAKGEEIFRICAGYLMGTGEKMRSSAVFLRGLFSTSRDLALVHEEFTVMLDGLFARLSQEEFVSLLPELRLAFSYFAPVEADRLAARAAALHGASGASVRRQRAVDVREYEYGEALDEWAAARL